MAGKREIVEKVMTAGITKEKSEQAVTLAFEAVADLCKRGESVTIKGFGTFRIKRRKAKIGRNPKTQEEVQIAAHDVLTFKDLSHG